MKEITKKKRKKNCDDKFLKKGKKKKQNSLGEKISSGVWHSPCFPPSGLSHFFFFFFLCNDCILLVVCLRVCVCPSCFFCSHLPSLLTDPKACSQFYFPTRKQKRKRIHRKQKFIIFSPSSSELLIQRLSRRISQKNLF